MKAFSLKGKLFASGSKISSVVALFEILQDQGQFLEEPFSESYERCFRKSDNYETVLIDKLAITEAE